MSRNRLVKTLFLTDLRNEGIQQICQIDDVGPFHSRHAKFVPSLPFLVVMIAVKDTKSVSFLKLEPFFLTGSTNDFLLFDPFIVSVLV